MVAKATVEKIYRKICYLFFSVYINDIPNFEISIKKSIISFYPKHEK